MLHFTLHLLKGPIPRFYRPSLVYCKHLCVSDYKVFVLTSMNFMFSSTDSDPDNWETCLYMVAQWLALLHHSEKVPGSIPEPNGTFPCVVCMFSLCLWRFPRSALVSPTKNVYNRIPLGPGHLRKTVGLSRLNKGQI